MSPKHGTAWDGRFARGRERLSGTRARRVFGGFRSQTFVRLLRYDSLMGFLICGSCARHVKAQDASCPFCGASTRDANRAGNPARVARNRLAILFGATTALITGSSMIASCGGDTSSDSAFSGDASRDVALTGVDAYGAPTAFYGCSIPDACGGEPPSEDSGVRDAGDANDASSDASNASSD
jgi:hypothetical protein